MRERAQELKAAARRGPGADKADGEGAVLADAGACQRSDYGDGQIFHVAMVVEFRDGKIWRDTRYNGEPFEAPAWRAQWVERMEESPARGGPST